LALRRFFDPDFVAELYRPEGPLDDAKDKSDG